MAMKNQKIALLGFLSAAITGVVIIGALIMRPSTHAGPQISDIMETYAGVALAIYQDADIQARALRAATAKLLAEPTQTHLDAAKAAWRAARTPYQYSEGFRFGNPIVDDWEGRLNAWPLDEGFIDYVAPGYGGPTDENPLARLDIIANKSIRVGAKLIDTSVIDSTLLAGLNGALNIESNVAAGYHAIEFLLWGQDLNGTGPGAGARPVTDFDPANCTGGHCARRVDFLRAAVDLLVSDLDEMVANWQPGGAARAALMERTPMAQLGTILTGLSLLSYGEMAGERMRLGLVLHDPEEESDCFSDNTHNALYDNQIGIMTIYHGQYTRLDGTKISGPSIAAYARKQAPAQAAAVEAAMDQAHAALMAIKETAESGRMAYDQMIGPDNPQGNLMVQQAIDRLVEQAQAIWTLSAALDLPLQIEGSEKLTP